MKCILFISAMMLSLTMQGQPVVTVKVSADTVSAGHVAEVTYTIENGQGDFQWPDMTGLPVISGPNSSSSFVYQDGQMRSSQSYSFRLRPMEEGRLTIPGSTYQTGSEVIRIAPVEIVVLSDTDVMSAPKIIGPASSSKSTREKKKF